jgi:hypothetical protein
LKADFLQKLRSSAEEQCQAPGAPKTCATLNSCATHPKQADGGAMR